jgi:hypothetical protein
MPSLDKSMKNDMIVPVWFATMNDEVLNKPLVHQGYQLNGISEDHELNLEYF